MHSRLHRRARSAAFAFAVLTLAAGACGADNGFVDLSTVDHTSTGEVDRAQLEPTTASVLAADLAGARSSASATYRAGGKGLLSATAVATGWIGGPGDATATAGTWIVDVITFHVANAAPHKTTSIRIESSMSGTAPSNGVWGKFTETSCIGTSDCSGLSIPDAVMAGADFPQATGLVSPAGGGSSVAPLSGPFDLGHSSIGFSLRGASAVVPIVLGISVSANGNSSSPGTGTISGSYQWAIHMPASVTCTSRTGLAFGGRCPAATVTR